MDKQLVGTRIRELRKIKGFTLKEVAGAAGISIGFLGDIESGRTRPSINTLDKLAKALNTTTDYLLGRTDNPQPQQFDSINKRPIIHDLVPRNEKNLGEALTRVSALAYKYKLTHDETTKLFEETVKAYKLPEEKGGIAAHGPRVPGQIRSKKAFQKGED